MTRLDWNLGADDPHGEALRLEDDVPDLTTAPARTWRPSAGALLLYTFALVVAGFLGFRLGRYSVAEAEVTQGIETALAIEGIAWKNADLDLYLSTLDPNAEPGWLDRETRAFAQSAPADYRASVLRHAAADGNRVDVVIEESVGGAPGEGPRPPAFTSNRTYRFVGGAWVRTPD